IKEGHAELIQLQSIIENELQNLKLRLEREKFHPHITLARVKDRRSLSKVVEIINSYKEEEFGNFSVKDFVLKQSILRSSGPIYNDIMRFKL
ncbi:MAG TPA: RNA 2',3'-cyclic phosphodiesterase, partial [Geobacterales bacterium]|nr:RNA 2',3'-cyclic phosphodiesterase [Geobacterales bacterium]